MKKFLSLILAFAMIFALATPAAAATTVSGDQECAVSGTFDPVIKIESASISGDTVTQDSTTGIYTVVVPAGSEATGTKFTTTIEGQGLVYHAGAVNVVLRNTLTYNGQTMTEDNALSEYGCTYANGALLLESAVLAGATMKLECSNDSGSTWFTLVEVVTKQAYAITTGEYENGTMTIDNESAVAGDTVTVTPTADEGYRLTELVYTTEDGAETAITANADGDYTFEMPEGAVTVTPTFSKLYSINIDTNITNGTVTSNVTQAVAGEKVELFVHGNSATDTTPEYQLESLTVRYTEGEETKYVDVADDHTFVMPAYDVTVTATFEGAVAYTITIDNSITGGKVESDLTTAAKGDDPILTVTPDDGYYLTAITVTDADGNTVTAHLIEGETSKYTFNMPASNVTVTASFEKITAKITGLYITIDGVKYDASNTTEADPAIINPSSEVKVTVTGTDFAYMATYTDTLSYFTYFGENLVALCNDVNWWTVDIANNTAVYTALHEILAKATAASELKYTNDRGANKMGSGVWVKYVIPTYTVTGYSDDNGNKVAADVAEAKEGDTVTLTVTCSNGYELSSISVINDITGETVAFDSTSLTDGYTFTMPAFAVTVMARFTEIKIVSATISWGSLAYTYDDTIPEGKTEENGWTKDTTDGAGTIIVINTGEAGIIASVEYQAEANYTEITGSFDADAVMIEPGSTGNSHTFTLSLSGKPDNVITAGTKIGTVTITIEDASGAE